MFLLFLLLMFAHFFATERNVIAFDLTTRDTYTEFASAHPVRLYIYTCRRILFRSISPRRIQIEISADTYPRAKISRRSNARCTLARKMSLWERKTKFRGSRADRVDTIWIFHLLSRLPLCRARFRPTSYKVEQDKTNARKIKFMRKNYMHVYCTRLPVLNTRLVFIFPTLSCFKTKDGNILCSLFFFFFFVYVLRRYNITVLSASSRIFCGSFLKSVKETRWMRWNQR